jgi:hypothetical protein
VDFDKWENAQQAREQPENVDGVLLTRYWLIPARVRPKMFSPHPLMSSDEIRDRTQGVWNGFYSLGAIWERSRCVNSLRGRMAFVMVSLLYRQMYANTGISTGSARRSRASFVAAMLAAPTLRLFQGKPIPELKVPARTKMESPATFTVLG